MNKQRYIIVIDEKGATDGYDGPYVPISHRFYWDGTGAVGAESLTRKFKSRQEMAEHFQQFLSAPSGTYKNFSWYVDAD